MSLCTNYHQIKRLGRRDPGEECRLDRANLYDRIGTRREVARFSRCTRRATFASAAKSRPLIHLVPRHLLKMKVFIGHGVRFITNVIPAATNPELREDPDALVSRAHLCGARRHLPARSSLWRRRRRAGAMVRPVRLVDQAFPSSKPPSWDTARLFRPSPVAHNSRESNEMANKFLYLAAQKP